MSPLQLAQRPRPRLSSSLSSPLAPYLRLLCRLPAPTRLPHAHHTAPTNGCFGTCNTLRTQASGVQSHQLPRRSSTLSPSPPTQRLRAPGGALEGRLLFSYSVLVPAALKFFVSYADGAVESLWSIDQYFEFVLVLMLSTGLSFQVQAPPTHPTPPLIPPVPGSAVHAFYYDKRPPVAKDAHAQCVLHEEGGDGRLRGERERERRRETERESGGTSG
jgi:hypothetical protein